MWSFPSTHNFFALHPQLEDNSTTRNIAMKLLLQQMRSCHHWRTIRPHATMPRAMFLHSKIQLRVPQFTSTPLYTVKWWKAHLSKDQITSVQLNRSLQNADVWVAGFEGQSGYNWNSPPDQTSLALPLPKYGFEGQSATRGQMNKLQGPIISFPLLFLPTSLILVPNFQIL